jgi:two-component system chemotaxis response regulator CheB
MSLADIVVVGSSLGGVRALETLLGALPPSFAPPVVVAQHRRAHGTSSLDRLIGSSSALPVEEVADRQTLQPSRVYLAPADYHVIVQRGQLTLSTEAPVSYARPSIDVLFDSASHAYRERVVGVVLTGASADGAAGAAEIVRRGGQVIVQDPQTAESSIAPRATLARTKAATVGTVEALAQWLCRNADRAKEEPWRKDEV